MGFEIEVKYCVADPAALIERLHQIGATGSGASEHADLYLAHPGRDFRQTDEALRLRRIGKENHITYKGPKRAGPTKTREEIELPLGSGPEIFSQWTTIFERLGFRPIALVKKTRDEFGVDCLGRHVSVTIDNTGALGHFAEVETLATDDADLAPAQEAVLELAARLGLTKVEPRSYLGMTLERVDRS